eukprot:11206244-Lingulodinium_polyedra.AAC.1
MDALVDGNARCLARVVGRLLAVCKRPPAPVGWPKRAAPGSGPRRRLWFLRRAWRCPCCLRRAVKRQRPLPAQRLP